MTKNRAPDIEIDWYDYNGLSVRYGIRRGDKDTVPLVIFNGIGQNIEVLTPIIDLLPGIEVVTYDVPGTGLSDDSSYPWRFRCHARLAAELLESLGYKQVNVMGISWGGGLAQQFSFQYPKRANKIILAATGPGNVMIPGKLTSYLKMANPRRFWDRNYMHSIVHHIYGGSVVEDRSYIDQHLGRVRTPSRRGYFYQWLGMLGWSSLPWLRFIKQPALILHGTQDPLVPSLNARIMAWIIPDSQLEFFDCGHMFMLTKTEEVIPHIRDFVQEH